MKNVFRASFVFSLVVLLFGSCVSNKEMTYMQGIDALYSVPQNIDANYGLTIQPDDELGILVTSKDKELIEPFNNGRVINGAAGSGTSSSQMSQFYVEKDGTISFPILGSIKVKDLTTEQVAEEIQKQIRALYISDAIVNVKVLSFKVTVMGAVKNPGVQTLSGQRVTLLEALGKAGDLNNTAVRKNILVVREENGKRISYRVDLTDAASVFNSPAYYLQQNDLVYVESNKAEKVKGSTSYTYISVIGTFIGLATSVISLIVALSK